MTGDILSAFVFAFLLLPQFNFNSVLTQLNTIYMKEDILQNTQKKLNSQALLIFGFA